MPKHRGRIQGVDWAIAPPKTFESNVFHHDFVQFGKTLDCQILLKSPPLNLRAGPAPAKRTVSNKVKVLKTAADLFYLVIFQ